MDVLIISDFFLFIMIAKKNNFHEHVMLKNVVISRSSCKQ
jgi:hypothetical protein